MAAKKKPAKRGRGKAATKAPLRTARPAAARARAKARAKAARPAAKKAAKPAAKRAAKAPAKAPKAAAKPAAKVTGGGRKAAAPLRSGAKATGLRTPGAGGGGGGGGPKVRQRGTGKRITQVVAGVDGKKSYSLPYNRGYQGVMSGNLPTKGVLTMLQRAERAKAKGKDVQPGYRSYLRGRADAGRQMGAEDMKGSP